MHFIVRHQSKIVATYPVDLAKRYSRGNAHEMASDHARTLDGATVSRVDDDGREKLCSTFSKQVLRDEALERGGLSEKVRGQIERKARVA